MRISIAPGLASRDGTVAKDAKLLNGFIEPKGQDVPAELRRRPGSSDLGIINASGTAQLLTYFNSQVISIVGAAGYRSTLGPLASIVISPATVFTAADYTSSDNGLTAGTTGWLVVKTPAKAWRIRTFDWAVFVFTDGNYPATTVPGVVYMDGYFFVMTPGAAIYNNDLNSDPAAAPVWTTTSFLTATKENGAGVYLTRSLNYIIALKEFSTEVYYNAGNPVPGSPLGVVDIGFSLVGCASAGSVAQLDGNVVWMAQKRQKGRSVYMMRGIQQQKVSTPDVERILNADDLATVWALGVNLDGHPTYLLTLVTSNITLAYDLTSQSWSQWSSFTLGANVSVTSITRSGTTATVTTGAAHNLLDGDPVKISGATQTDYNGIFQISYVSATVYTIQVANSPTTPATGTILSTPYTETYFKFTKYVNAGGKDILLHESNGHLYQISSSLYQDAGIPINTFARTDRINGGSLALKKLSRLSVEGDKVSDFPVIRWSDDDSTTFTTYRRVDMSLDRPALRRCGAFRERSVEMRFVGNNQLRIEALDFGD